MLGGGMRQAGIIAAAGIIALEKMTQRLPEDHATARHIAAGLASIPGIVLNLADVQTNIVFVTFTHLSATDVSARLADRGILASPSDGRRMRLVTHHQVSPADAARVVIAVREICAEIVPAPVTASAAVPSSSA